MSNVHTIHAGNRPFRRAGRTVAQRWAERVVLPPNPDDCWGWVGSKDRNGGGALTIDHRTVPAYRWGYEKFIGPIPEGMQLDHFKCDNHSCVNPAHVRPVTARENTLRSNAPSAWYAARTHCNVGHELTVRNERGLSRRFCSKCCNKRRNERINERIASDPAFRAKHYERNAARARARRARGKATA